jgi:AcrR family transcriptional regulator
MGRPKEFCTEQALKMALAVFWRYGFEGASLAELTKAMGITKPSLYASYGNKEDLFRKALDLYDATHLAFMRDALGEPTSRGVASRILYGVVRSSTADDHPAGCMSTNGTLVCSAATEGIRTEVLRRRQAFERALRERLVQARRQGDLLPEIEPDDLVTFVATVSAGLCLQASSGASRASLNRTVELALAAWPSRSETPSVDDRTVTA